MYERKNNAESTESTKKERTENKVQEINNGTEVWKERTGKNVKARKNRAKIRGNNNRAESIGKKTQDRKWRKI